MSDTRSRRRGRHRPAGERSQGETSRGVETGEASEAGASETSEPSHREGNASKQARTGEARTGQARAEVRSGQVRTDQARAEAEGQSRSGGQTRHAKAKRTGGKSGDKSKGKEMSSYAGPSDKPSDKSSDKSEESKEYGEFGLQLDDTRTPRQPDTSGGYDYSGGQAESSRRNSRPVAIINLPRSRRRASGSHVALATHGGRQVNKTTVHIDNLDEQATRRDIAEAVGDRSVEPLIKIFADKSNPTARYAFVQFSDEQAAAAALARVSGARIGSCYVTAQYAYNNHAVSTGGHSSVYSVFVGDLGPDVGDVDLHRAFEACGAVEARVMWDMATGRSRGYGFVKFATHAHASRAISSMSGARIGSRAIHCSWASRKPGSAGTDRSAANSGTSSPAIDVSGSIRDRYEEAADADQAGGTEAGSSAPAYEAVFSATPHAYTTVYLGNLPLEVSTGDVLALTGQFGYITHFKHQAGKDYAFISFSTHDAATTAICQLQGYEHFGNGRLKCSWGSNSGRA